MNNQLCKIFIGIFSILFLCLSFETTASAATLQSGYLTFSENEDGTLTVTGYDREKHESPYCLEVNSTYIINEHTYNVSNISDNLFNGYTFYSIYVGEGTCIGNYSFANTTVNSYKYNTMERDKAVLIESKTIGKYAFQNAVFYCDSYFTKVEHIADYAFESTCFSVHEVNLYNTLLSIGKGAFKNATNIGSISSSFLQSIGQEAFYNTEPTYIYIPDSITFIGENAIPNLSTLGIEINPGVSNFTNLHLNHLSSVIFWVYKDSPGLQFAIDNELIYGFAGTDEVIYPKAKIGQIIGEDFDFAIGRVTGDSTCTLIGGTFGITEYTSGPMISIGTSWFIDYYNHSYSVNAVGKGAFDNLPSSITGIYLGDEILKIETGTFTNNKNLKEIHLSANTKTIEKNAFPNSSNLKIVIPDQITDISNFHFKNLTNVVFCASDTNPVIKTLSKMGLCYQYAFGGRIYYPQPKKGTTFAYKKSQYKVTGKSTATFLKPVTKNITTLNVPRTVSHKGYTYKVTKIDKKACYKLKKLKTVTIGDNVTHIGDNSFANCSKLTSITFGKNVKRLGKKVLYNDKKLKKIKFKGTKLQAIGKQTFRNVSKKASIIVPTSKVKKYSRLIKNAK